MYGSIYRHVLLPLFDRHVKGRNTLDYWKEFEETQWLPAAELEARQLAALQALLRHADQHCVYYQRLWREQGLRVDDLQTLSDFTRWPLLTRDEIRRNRDGLRNTAGGPLLAKATGGSSGEPLQFDLNSDSNDRRTALMYRGYGWAGGAPGTRQLYMWGGPLATVSRFKRWKQRLHMRIQRQKLINCFDFVPERMREHVAAWNRYRPEVIVAYTNPLYELARFVEEHGLTLRPPRSIVVGAEKLYDFQRELLERVIGAPVFETYGSREFMLIGAECERHAGLHISQENLLLEVLDDQGRPTPAGEEGQVVITDLFNYGLPFVRYVNGDRAIAGLGSCPCGRGLPVLKQVTGRQLDTLDTPDGRKIPGEFFPHLVKEFPQVRRFQVVQDCPGTIVLKLVAPQLDAEPRRRLLEAIQVCTGTEVKVDLQLVDDIPLTAAGKLKVVVRGKP